MKVDVRSPVFLRRVDEAGVGFGRMPAEGGSERIDKIPYGRFRNVYLYITEACQLRCQHCYMGERLDRAHKMTFEAIRANLQLWRYLGGSKLTILGGEPTLHDRYCDVIRLARAVGYEHVITTSNGQMPARRKFRQLEPDDFAYVQISVDGGSSRSHDAIRGEGTFDVAVETTRELVDRGFDTRIICTVSRANVDDCLDLLDLADRVGISLVKFHVFSTIGRGRDDHSSAMTPLEWIEFYEHLNDVSGQRRTRVWYQPTFARRESVSAFADDGYRGCVGRTMDRISIFPDGRCYVCSYLFDTNLFFAQLKDSGLEINKDANELDLFFGSLTRPGCSSCKEPAVCAGGCPAEEIVTGKSSCAEYPGIVPVCRLWKAVAGVNG